MAALILEPASTLTFKRPFREVRKETLVATNTGATPLLFKVRTTAPKQYCVRPCAGIIKPNDKQEIDVLLQPFKEEPPFDYKCRDKFLIQYVAVSQEDASTTNHNDLWTNIEAKKQAPIEDVKLKVVYAPGEPPSPAPAQPLSTPIAVPTATTTTTKDGADVARRSESMLKDAYSEVRTVKAENEALRQQLRDAMSKAAKAAPGAVGTATKAQPASKSLLSNILFLSMIMAVAFAVGLQLGINMRW